MLKKTIAYTDLNDESRKEDFYFNFSIQELIDMELEVETEGGLKAKLEKMVAAEDVRSMLGVMKDIVLRALGKKSDDGKRFDKSEAFRDDFYNSPAYGALLMELIGKPGAAAEFFNGLMPKELMQRVNEIQKARGMTVTQLPVAMEDAAIKDPELRSLQERVDMSEEEFDKTYGTNPKKWSKVTLTAAMRRYTTSRSEEVNSS